MGKCALVKVVALTGLCLAGTGYNIDAESVAETEETAEYDALYHPVTDEIYKYLFEFNTEEDGDAFGGLGEVKYSAMERTDALQSVGYCIEDISGDGVPELLIGALDSSGDTYESADLYAVYTLKDDTPTLVVSSFARSHYRLDEEGLFYTGSAGAAESGFGLFSLNNEVTELICKDFYFTAPDPDKEWTIEFYHNRTGEWDKDLSEKLDISEEDFWDLQEKNNVYEVEMIPFSKYFKYALRIEESGEDVGELKDTNTVNVILQDGEFAAEYTLLCEKTIHQVKIYRLSVKDVSEEGEASYLAEEVYTCQELLPEEGIIIKMELPELFPICGISYEDTSGVHQLAVYESGRDGLVYLDEVSF